MCFGMNFGLRFGIASKGKILEQEASRTTSKGIPRAVFLIIEPTILPTIAVLEGLNKT